jgi:hypothetical protein
MYENDDNGLGSLHLRSAVKTLVNPIATTKAIVAQAKRSKSTMLNPIVALKKTTAQLKRAKPFVKAITKTLMNPIATAKLALNPLAQIKNIRAEVVKPKAAPAQQQVLTQDVYQDANGNVITKEEYDRQMAEVNADSQPIYQDENGNVITKAEYDAAMAAPQTIYRDENGNVITETEYNALVAKYAAEEAAQQTLPPVIAPIPVETDQVYTDQSYSPQMSLQVSTDQEMAPQWSPETTQEPDTSWQDSSGVQTEQVVQFTGPQVYYTDANGTPVSEDQYDMLMSQGAAPQAYYYDDNSNEITKEAFDAVTALQTKTVAKKATTSNPITSTMLIAGLVGIALLAGRK